VDIKQERDALYDIMVELSHTLSELEWSGIDTEECACCPVCGVAEELRKHSSDCKLNTILNRAASAEKGDFSNI